MNIKKYVTKVNIIIAICVLSAIIGAFFIGKSVKFDSLVVNTVAMNKENRDNDIKKRKEELYELNEKVSANQDKLEKISKYEDIDAQIASANSKLDEASNNLSSVNSQISEKQSELDKLNGNITKAKSSPKTLPAGQFTVGKDISSGRYSISGDSNLAVYDTDGSVKVNTILGDGDWGEEQYVCELNDGDTIKAESKDTYTPIN